MVQSKSHHSSLTIALDVDHTRVLAALVDPHGQMGLQTATDTPEDGDTLLAIIADICHYLKSNASQPIGQVTISTMNNIHGATSYVAPQDSNIQQFITTSLIESLSAKTSLPTIFINRVDAIATAEAHLGAGVGIDNMLLLYIDAGIDAAIIHQGAIATGMPTKAGQISQLVAGWMGQRPIPLTNRASGNALAAEYNMRSRKFRVPSLQDIIQYAHQGDQLAVRVLRDGAQVLGSVIAPVVSMIDPQRVVVAGGLVDAGEVWWNAFVDSFDKSDALTHHQTYLAQASLGETASIIGSALILNQQARS